MILVRFFTMLAATVMLTGCVIAPAKVHGTGRVDHSEKTISVPPGREGVLGVLKDALATDGWTLVVRNEDKLTTTRSNQSLTQSAHPTRYDLVENSAWVDFGITGEGIYSYDITLIDNKTRQEIFTLEGVDFASKVTKPFLAALRR